jgi:hypothetical protein
MSQTRISGDKQISSDTVTRHTLNTTETGKAVIRKIDIIEGSNLVEQHTGVDFGTGDVSLKVNVRRSPTWHWVSNTSIKSPSNKGQILPYKGRIKKWFVLSDSTISGNIELKSNTTVISTINLQNNTTFSGLLDLPLDLNSLFESTLNLSDGSTKSVILTLDIEQEM